MPKFEVVSPYQTTGDQPEAVEKLAKGFLDGKKFQTLLGVTGSGKTFTMANIIEKYRSQHWSLLTIRPWRHSSIMN